MGKNYNLATYYKGKILSEGYPRNFFKKNGFTNLFANIDLDEQPIANAWGINVLYG